MVSRRATPQPPPRLFILEKLSGNSYAWARRLTIKRTSGSDALKGRGGNATLRLQAAGDELCGGPARDFAYGGSRGASMLADETLFGSVPTSQAGNDVIYGGPGREEVDRARLAPTITDVSGISL
jgi:Ca2+-binding RTX toxin-like protein